MSNSRSFPRYLYGLAICLISVSFASAQTTAPSETRKTSTPYAGDLSIFDTPGRDEKLQINRVMDILNIHPGTTVADIGAGGGWFSVRAARRVGEGGMVYAVDINPAAVQYISQRAEKEKLNNLKTVLSTPDDPKLPPHAIDAVLLLKVYHEVAKPVTLMTNLRASLKPDAKIGIIDRNGDAENHGVNRDIVIREMQRAGYRLVQQEDFVKSDRVDYFLVFSVKR